MFRLASFRRMALGWLATSALLFVGAGCTSFLTTAMYLIKGNTIDAEYDGLKGKKVAVVCRPIVQLSFSNGKVDSQLARELGTLLKMNLRKTQIVDPQRVEEWTDAHEWNDFAEIGKGVEADMLVAIDLQDFNLYAGQTLFQGKGKASVKVYDIKDGGRIVFQKHMPQFLYPPNSGRPTSEMQPDEFRREFTNVFAEEIGRLFYGYDAKLNYARDTAVLH